MSEACEDLKKTCETRFHSLEEWQTRQNGSLGRIELKLDKVLESQLTRARATTDNLIYKVGVPLLMLVAGGLLGWAFGG